MIKNIILTTLSCAVFFAAVPAFAQPEPLTYTPLEPIPGLEEVQGGNANFVKLVNAVFKVLITLGGFTAVVLLIVGGIGYMVSEAAFKKTQAKERVWAAVWGIGILGTSYIVLNTINPQLVTFDRCLLSPFNECENMEAGGGRESDGTDPNDTRIQSGAVSDALLEKVCAEKPRCSIPPGVGYITYNRGAHLSTEVVAAKREFHKKCEKEFYDSTSSDYYVKGVVYKFRGEYLNQPERNGLICLLP